VELLRLHTLLDSVYHNRNKFNVYDMKYSFIETSVTCISRGIEKVKDVIRSLCWTSANVLRFHFGKLR
jgi:hypothetical protein